MEMFGVPEIVVEPSALLGYIEIQFPGYFPSVTATIVAKTDVVPAQKFILCVSELLENQSWTNGLQI